MIVAPFEYTDGRGLKTRPAVVISSETYHASRRELIIAAVTSNTERVLLGDHIIARWHEAGLRRPSIATAIVRTITQDMIDRRLGRLSNEDLSGVKRGLGLALDLSHQPLA